jgi:glycogen operon protein
LRYWAAQGIDGFRFDLAVSLVREDGAFRANAQFLTSLAANPVLSRLKLIAEPWDSGPDGYRLGAFPAPWAEWNDRFRNSARRFWRGDSGQVPDLATRLSGSSDVMGTRGPLASINFVTSHDGFTLADLVSYAAKHNEANGENNADGSDENDSWNRGVEGPTGDEAIRATRLRDRRNLMATLLLSLGVPMLTAGDELGRSQNGNNNAYCQDNDTSWIDWSKTGPEDDAFLRFVRRAIRVRRGHPILRRTVFYAGRPDAQGRNDMAWLLPDGAPMQDADWRDASLQTLACAFGGTERDETALRYILLLNAGTEAVDFILPAGQGGPWLSLLDTAATDGGDYIRIAKGGTWPLGPRSLVLFSEIP